MKKVILKIEGMTCSACSNGLEKYLNKQVGVKNAVVNLIMNNASIEYEEDKIDIKKIPEYIEHLNYTFNSIKLGYPDVMSEERYKELLSDLSNDFATVTKALPLLETEKELKKSNILSICISFQKNPNKIIT